MKRIALPLIFSFLLYFNGSLLIAQNSSNYYFSHINGENGLSASNVKTILQDSYGFMWFGTKNGLNRYDGTSILQLNCKDLHTGMGNNNISTLFEDSNQKLWVGTDRGIYIYDPTEDNFTQLRPSSAEGVTPDNWVAEILSDTQGDIWVLIPDQGVFCFRKEKMKYYPITGRANIKTESPNCMCINDKGEIWVGTTNLGLFQYNRQEDTFEQRFGNSGEILVGKSIEGICAQGDDLILAVLEGEVMKYHTASGKLTSLIQLNNNKTILRDIECFGNEVWVGSHHGLYIINTDKQSITHLKEDLMRSFSLSDNIIYKIYRDSVGGVWIGTMFGGVNYLPDHSLMFSKYVPGSDGNSLNTKRIRGLAEDADGNIWIGTEDSGINVLNPQNGRVHRINGSNPDHLISVCVEYHDKKVYCGLFKQGMDVVSLPGEHLRNYSEKKLGIEEGSVYSFLIDSKGRKWIGTGWGLYMADRDKETYTRIDQVGYGWIFDIMEATDGTIWFATMGIGIWKCNADAASFQWYPSEQTNLKSNSISAIMEDSKGNIWFSTDRGGISRYNKGEDNFTTFTVEDGLPDDVTYDMLEDNRGNLWFGTNKGLVKFNPDTRDVRVFTTKDGLLGNQFNYKSALKAKDGRFYFGGVDGLVAFNPHAEEKYHQPAPVYISKLSIYNKEVTVHTPHSPLKKSITHTEKIVLPYNQANLSFDIALLSYSAGEANQYYYKMEPVDKDWIRAISNQNISYAKLSPGRYTFQVKAASGGNIEEASFRSLSIDILPPWWQSSWAYLLYTICIILTVYGCLLWYKQRKERQMEERQKLFEVRKEKELYESKVEFFTEIAHEIRTPLSLINGPLEAIQEMEIQETGLKKYINVMVQNTKRLLELTGQLLDFQKISANKLVMKFESVDVTALLKETVARFEITINLNKKELILNLTDETVWASVDKEAITKILSNLLNNALKYARKTIVVELESDRENFTIRVTSDGNRIPEGISQRIFEPFYQTEGKEEPRNGVGIGLSLARSLALLHKGTLYLDTKQEDNAFVLNVPLNKGGIIRENDKAIQKDIVVLDEETSIATDMHSYTLLFVEDNESMLTFIQERLQEFFTVEVARNGKEALEILRSIHVDLIISDIMMPVMNGYQLCKEVKSDINLSHIPLIFLTAKNDLDSKINGLKYGAEAYVEKPFSFNYLKEQVLSLLDNRRREREAFSKRPFFTVDNMQMNKADEDFMNRVIQIIEENITDDSFGVERMAEILYMSRSSLLRKIKTLFNLSTLDFIRLIKLKKAAEYIQEGRHRISDVCYMVGINSPSYFSKIFTKQFGMSPKDFERQHQPGKQPVIPEELKNAGENSGEEEG
ncbi:two-component regulator propeller domain-containing protein [Bacteroides sp. 224]|uniref:hybrid sensor histidine kinase/response regulator transcription factor n=1 Tax=Bacteroides sp. 224 TaxID=2302936 RepID=UPI0013D2663B|nr:two-component regulator propeller domain-containing protein [Bacteroides sp. 224]NDV64264.1 response regulator [Bacteroides sp. 224]